MRLRITKAINEVMRNHFEGMLLNAGAFPEINFRKEKNWTSYNMIEYSETYARFAKLVDKRLIDAGLDTLGVFTRKHSASFIEELRKIVCSVTEDEVYEHRERFKTIFD